MDELNRIDFESWCRKEGLSTKRNSSGEYLVVESHWRLWQFKQEEYESLFEDYIDARNDAGLA